MIQETIARIEARLRATKGTQDPSRAEVLQLLGDAQGRDRRQLESRRTREHARAASRASPRFRARGHTAYRRAAVVDLSLQGLRSSVEGFEYVRNSRVWWRRR